MQKRIDAENCKPNQTPRGRELREKVKKLKEIVMWKLEKKHDDKIKESDRINGSSSTKAIVFKKKMQALFDNNVNQLKLLLEDDHNLYLFKVIEEVLEDREKQYVHAATCYEEKMRCVKEKEEEIKRLKNDLKDMEMRYKCAANKISPDEYHFYKSEQEAKARGDYFEISDSTEEESDSTEEEKESDQ